MTTPNPKQYDPERARQSLLTRINELKTDGCTCTLELRTTGLHHGPDLTCPVHFPKHG